MDAKALRVASGSDLALNHVNFNQILDTTSESAISPSNSSSTRNKEAVSPENIEGIPLCDRIPESALRSFLDEQVFRDTVSRSIKPPRRLLPPGWKPDWVFWNENDDLHDIASRSTTEIYLEGKFNLVFRDVHLIMYDSNSLEEVQVQSGSGFSFRLTLELACYRMSLVTDSTPSDNAEEIPFCDRISDRALRSYLNNQVLQDTIPLPIEPPP
ncbi:hypothetical protein C8J56DRAFT_1054482 [Mycena floridula]|nr:hypothetical protein C8J56DRAFT_1054482 [Mycena floridula]